MASVATKGASTTVPAVRVAPAAAVRSPASSAMVPPLAAETVPARLMAFGSARKMSDPVMGPSTVSAMPSVRSMSALSSIEPSETIWLRVLVSETRPVIPASANSVLAKIAAAGLVCTKPPPSKAIVSAMRVPLSNMPVCALSTSRPAPKLPASMTMETAWLPTGNGLPSGRLPMTISAAAPNSEPGRSSAPAAVPPRSMTVSV